MYASQLCSGCPILFKKEFFLVDGESQYIDWRPFASITKQGGSLMCVRT